VWPRGSISRECVTEIQTFLVERSEVDVLINPTVSRAFNFVNFVPVQILMRGLAQEILTCVSSEEQYLAVTVTYQKLRQLEDVRVNAGVFRFDTPCNEPWRYLSIQIMCEDGRRLGLHAVSIGTEFDQWP
jgi:hypothetical protein